MIEISHESVNNVDKFIEELKEGTIDFYDNFVKFYSEKKDHNLAEYEEWIDVNEYLNVMVMNLYYGNIDFPGNNYVLWRPNDDAKDCPLPKRFRVIVKDTDFGIGLYSRSSDVNTIGMIYKPSQYRDTWAFTEPATRMFKNMMENEDLRQMFIDKSCVYMGDFMNAEGTGATMDAILDEALEEFVAHRNKYNSGGGWGGWQTDNRADILNKFENAKRWLSGYTETSHNWWTGKEETRVVPSRNDYFLDHMSSQWKLGTAIPVTVNKDVTDLPDSVVVNDIALSEGIFDGKLFPNRQYVITGKAPEGKSIKGWKVTKDGKSNTVNNSELALTLEAGIKSVSIEAILGDETGISTASVQPLWQWKRTVGGVNVSNVPAGEKVSLYDLRGVLLSESVSDGSDIFLSAASGKLYILKVGSESVKIQ